METIAFLKPASPEGWAVVSSCTLTLPSKGLACGQGSLNTSQLREPRLTAAIGSTLALEGLLWLSLSSGHPPVAGFSGAGRAVLGENPSSTFSWEPEDAPGSSVEAGSGRK